jgi:hypothetical protein
MDLADPVDEERNERFSERTEFTKPMLPEATALKLTGIGQKLF